MDTVLEIMASRVVAVAEVAMTEAEGAIEVEDTGMTEEETEDTLTLMTQLSMHSRFRIQIGKSYPMMTYSERLSEEGRHKSITHK